MQLITILIQLLFIFETVILINALFFPKSKKYDHKLIYAKYDPEMPKRVRKILEQIGDNPIIKIQLGRTPVKAGLLLFLNLVSGWKFEKKQLELGYDEIYHNYLLITIQNEKQPNVLQTMITTDDDAISSTIYKLEKAARIQLGEPTYPTEFIDTYDVPLTPNKILTLNRLITVASNVDKQFYTYDAGNNNMCQTFVENIIDINGLTQNIIDEPTRLALKPQDGRALIATLGNRSDIVKRITDLGGTVDKWVHDRKITWKRPVKKEFAVIGNMHIKVANDDTNDKTNDILPDNNDVVIVNGTSDIILENENDVFDAVVALEDEDKGKERNKMILKILCIIIAIILLIGAVIAISFFIWRKRKDKSQQNKIINDNIYKTKSESNLSEVSDTTENE